MPIKQISIELYQPLTGGIFFGGRFAPETLMAPLEELERAVKEVITGQKLQVDALLKDAPDAACKVWVDRRGHSEL